MELKPPANCFVLTKRMLAGEDAMSVDAKTRRTRPGSVTQITSSAPADRQRFRLISRPEAPVIVMAPPVVSRRLSQYSLPAEAALMPPSEFAAVARIFWRPASTSYVVAPAGTKLPALYTKFAPVTVCDDPVVIDGVT